MVTVALILLLVIALLAVPLRLDFSLSRHEAVEGDVSLQWLFGLARVKLSTAESQRGNEAQRRVAPSHKRGASSLNISRALRQKPFRSRLIRFVRDIWHAIRREDFWLNLQLGVEDPADTGQLWAILGPLSGMFFASKDADITIVPDFIDSGFQFEGSGTVRLIPLQLLYLVMGLLLSPAIWRGLNSARIRHQGGDFSHHTN